MTESRFYDLRQKTALWASQRTALPERILTPMGESLERINLPGASLCSDFLVTSPNIWAGVTIAVEQSQIPAVWKLFEKCSSTLVRRILPKEAASIKRYEDFSGFGWIEVLWLLETDLKLVEVQTNEVLWYAVRGKTGKLWIAMMALEDLTTLLKQPEYPLVLPPMRSD